MPEAAATQRLLSQHTNDIGALYELVQGVDEKVDTLTDELRAHRAATDQKFDALTDELRAHAAAFRAHRAATDEKFDEILRALRDR